MGVQVTKHSVISANPTVFGTDKVVRPETNSKSVADESFKVAIAGLPKDTSRKQDKKPVNSMEEQEEDLDYDGDEVIVPRSQEDLIREAFAGDDVEAEFQEAKAAAVDEECPQEELERMDLPGWGQWTDIQKKRGPPQWMLKQQEEAKRKKEEAEKRRLDAKLKHVIISQKTDKKAAKFLSSSLPFPYTSKEVFEKTMRMPLGIIKRAGVIIDPIEYEDVGKRKRKQESNSHGARERKRKQRMGDSVSNNTAKDGHSKTQGWAIASISKSYGNILFDRSIPSFVEELFCHCCKAIFLGYPGICIDQDGYAHRFLHIITDK
ncbi:hypothetical protein SELMODRAFT_413707 [Selaginella moellendorffii]|uniref:Uncharacterized protein n=1 Tax=Selaginella moellendorffii TaxID=88036 RepID=D8RPZ1_SELML|nr:hypothetical protein SELMODRAFT_413707 [Selaginella moellendorffii]